MMAAVETPTFTREWLGSGSFSEAWRTGPNTVELVSTCPSKAAYAEFSQGNPFAPKCEKHPTEKNTVIMAYYESLEGGAFSRLLNDDGKRVFRVLQEIFGGCGTPYHNFCEAVEESDELTPEEKVDIISLASDVANAIDPDDMRFEICPVNASADENGNLILRDCFFSRELLEQAWR